MICLSLPAAIQILHRFDVRKSLTVDVDGPLHIQARDTIVETAKVGHINATTTNNVASDRL